MAVCFFGNDYEHRYKCEYEALSDQIIVTVDYDIKNEIEDVNGVKAFGINTKFDNRDILIADHDNKINYLIKNACYNGVSSVYGTPDSGSKTRFASTMFFSSESFQSLAELKETPKVSSITIVSKDLEKLVTETSVSRVEYEDKLVISLNRRPNGETRQIGSHNIKEILLQEHWSGGFKKDHDIVLADYGNATDFWSFFKFCQ